MKREVLFYRKPDGRCPVEEFLDSLPAKAAPKIVWVLNLAEDLERIPARYFCKLADTNGREFQEGLLPKDNKGGRLR